jgi:tRNA-Thr(GGU) m(6)t(6)A37 methyltransferase TsaA
MAAVGSRSAMPRRTTRGPMWDEAALLLRPADRVFAAPKNSLSSQRPKSDAMVTPIVIKPIGVVRSALRDRRDAPRQPFEGAPQAILEIDAGFVPALHRITPGTELIVVTWLHEADRDIMQVHPMDDERIPLTGVFATRSPDRPNPIGLHRVTVTNIHAPTRVHVDALEAIDGTPILDLKIVMKDAPDA